MSNHHYWLTMIKYYQSRTPEQVAQDRITLLYMAGIAVAVLTAWGVLLLLERLLIG